METKKNVIFSAEEIKAIKKLKNKSKSEKLMLAMQKLNRDLACIEKQLAILDLKKKTLQMEASMYRMEQGD